MKPISHLIKTFFVSLFFLIPTLSQGATIASDGGVTLWLSYELDINDDITQDLSSTSASCTPTNDAREALLGPGSDSPGSCGDGSAGETCTGVEKLTGDLEKFAEYLYESSEGAHYLRHVYISDQGRGWETADVKWHVNSGGSSVPMGSKWDVEAIGTTRSTPLAERQS